MEVATTTLASSAAPPCLSDHQLSLAAGRHRSTAGPVMLHRSTDGLGDAPLLLHRSTSHPGGAPSEHHRFHAAPPCSTPRSMAAPLLAPVCSNGDTSKRGGAAHITSTPSCWSESPGERRWTRSTFRRSQHPGLLRRRWHGIGSTKHWGRRSSQRLAARPGMGTASRRPRRFDWGSDTVGRVAEASQVRETGRACKPVTAPCSRIVPFAHGNGGAPVAASVTTGCSIGGRRPKVPAVTPRSTAWPALLAGDDPMQQPI